MLLQTGVEKRERRNSHKGALWGTAPLRHGDEVEGEQEGAGEADEVWDLFVQCPVRQTDRLADLKFSWASLSGCAILTTTDAWMDGLFG